VARRTSKRKSARPQVPEQVKVKLKSGKNISHSRLPNFTLEKGIRVKEGYVSKKLAEYFSVILLSGNLVFLHNGATFDSISDVRRLSTRAIGNSVYSFLLTYIDKGCKQRINLVLKTYGKGLDPVLRTYAKCENLERSAKEFQVLRGLERAGFPVPSAYLWERDSNVLGYPFIIVLKEELTRNSTNNISCFAKNLASLHSLDVTTLGIDALKAPEDTYAFARRCLLYIKIYLNLYPRHTKELKKDFEFAIRWLESNVSNARCPKYSLLHGDYRAGINAIMTKDSRMVVMDWEDAEIGDPAYDVGISYARARVDFGEKTAERFVQEYVRHFDGALAERLLFYKLVAHLRLAISHSSILSSPQRTYEIRGAKAFLLFPFHSLPFIAKHTGAELDAIWVECFKEFVKENFRPSFVHHSLT
jgi:aminoglycoside phosphotransferase (APT) family kinase protein